jgi:hypothetical protein
MTHAHRDKQGRLTPSYLLRGTRLRWLSVALACAVLGVVICGCGGRENASAHSAGAAPSLAEGKVLAASRARHAYAVRAESICAAYNAEIRAVGCSDRGAFTPIRRQMASAEAVNLISLREAAALLRIPEPERLRGLSAVYRAIAFASRLGETSVKLMRHGNATGATRVAGEAAIAVRRINYQLRAYGLMVVAEV